MNIRIILYILVSALLITAVNIRRKPYRLNVKNSSSVGYAAKNIDNFDASDEINYWIESNVVSARKTVIEESKELKSGLREELKEITGKSKILKVAKQTVSGIYRHAKSSIQEGLRKVVQNYELS